MKLLLQAGIHLIKKVITFVIYGRSVQVFKACTLLYFSPLSFSSRRFFFVGRFCPTDFTDIHRYLLGRFLSHADFADDADFFSWDFYSSDFTEESEAFLFAGLLTDFRGILAAGQWLAPYICSCCFLSRRFR